MDRDQYHGGSFSLDWRTISRKYFPVVIGHRTFFVDEMERVSYLAGDSKSLEEVFECLDFSGEKGNLSAQVKPVDNQRVMKAVLRAIPLSDSYVEDNGKKYKIIDDIHSVPYKEPLEDLLSQESEFMI